MKFLKVTGDGVDVDTADIPVGNQTIGSRANYIVLDATDVDQLLDMHEKQLKEYINHLRTRFAPV